MKKPGKKPHYIKEPLKPEWEDEEISETLEDPRLKEEEEEEARLFKEAVEKGPVPQKDNDKQIPTRTNTPKSPKSASSRHDIDLHGMTVSEAQDYVIHTITALLDQAKGQPIDIRIITGKGHHSQGRQPQLISSIHHVVEARFRQRIIHIEASPHELRLGGAYLKGHFDLRIK